jgi:CDP-glucose 4,6-dehydratase
LDPSVENIAAFCDAYNFGPQVTNNKNVKELVEAIIEKWGIGSWKWISPEQANHESALLNLSIDKAYHKLGWLPRWNFDETIAHTVVWYQMALHKPASIYDFTLKQIRAHQSDRSGLQKTIVTQEATLNS